MSAERLRPLLRLNDWARLEADQVIAERRAAMLSVRESFQGADSQLEHCYERLRGAVAGANIPSGGYSLASEQAGAWLGAVRRLRGELQAAEGALQEALARAAELRKQRSILERRSQERRRDDAAQHELRELAELDNLWLSRGGS